MKSYSMEVLLIGIEKLGIMTEMGLEVTFWSLDLSFWSPEGGPPIPDCALPYFDNSLLVLVFTAKASMDNETLDAKRIASNPRRYPAISPRSVKSSLPS